MVFPYQETAQVPVSLIHACTHRMIPQYFHRHHLFIQLEVHHHSAHL